MRPRERELFLRLDAKLLFFNGKKRRLPGILNATRRKVFLEQLIESVRRVKYVSVIRTRQPSIRRFDPNDELFDPLKAAILAQRQGNIEEAFWLVFLFVHFGKHPLAGWRYIREVYGRLGDRRKWNWENTSNNPSGFRAWLSAHQDELKRGGMPRGFGNHRKYESLDGHTPNGTGAVVESYVKWVGPPRSHQAHMAQARRQANNDPRETFDRLYKSMYSVARFGRLARFDYLTLIGKLDLAPIKPGSTYMQGATGPVKGARILFGNRASAAQLDAWLVELDSELNVGMQALEDALCNWQKSLEIFVPFRG